MVETDKRKKPVIETETDRKLPSLKNDPSHTVVSDYLAQSNSPYSKNLSRQQKSALSGAKSIQGSKPGIGLSRIIQQPDQAIKSSKADKKRFSSIDNPVMLTTEGSNADLSVLTTDNQDNYSILQIRRKKNMADRDAQLLANRITLLSNEEQKLMKKIQNTRRRAEQILEIKKFNEERHLSIIQAEQEKEKEIQSKQQQILQDRLQKRYESESRYKARLEDLRGNASEIKEQRSFIIDVKQQVRLEQIQRNMVRKETVRSMEREALEKLQKRREDILKSIQITSKLRKDQEVEEVAKKEKHISMMESIETQMLQKLQHTQKKESAVYAHLEKAIQDSLLAHKQRLEYKQKKNEEIRKNYKLPPSLAHLEEVLCKSQHYQNQKSQTTIGTNGGASRKGHSSLTVATEKTKENPEVESKATTNDQTDYGYSSGSQSQVKKGNAPIAAKLKL